MWQIACSVFWWGRERPRFRHFARPLHDKGESEASFCILGSLDGGGGSRPPAAVGAGRDRVETFGLISMGVLVVTALWQVFFLRSFFRSKKLL